MVSLVDRVNDLLQSSMSH